MIRDTIDLINRRIAQQILVVNVQTAGIAVPFYDQQEKGTSLSLIGSQSRLGIDDRYAWQSAHLADGYRVTKTQPWGSFTETTYEVRFVLICLSKRPYEVNKAMLALSGVAHVVIDGVNNKTLEVLSRYWYVRAGQNYDPALQAFAIQYHFEGVTDSDFTEISSLLPAAQLPVYGLVEPDQTNSAERPSLVIGHYACATPISGGRLVRDASNGLGYYDATYADNAFGLLGISLQAGSPPDLIDVGLEGLITHPGWNLVPGTSYLAGPNGQLVTSADGLAFCQVIGQAVDADTLNFSPQTPIFTQ